MSRDIYKDTLSVVRHLETLFIHHPNKPLKCHVSLPKHQPHTWCYSLSYAKECNDDSCENTDDTKNP